MPHRPLCRSTFYAVGIALLIPIASLPLTAKVSRKDVIIMKNGDRLTGEVKKLENGVLYVQTDYFSGSVGMDWLQVERVVSTGGFQVTLRNGERAAGTIEKVSAEDAPRSDFKVHTNRKEVRAAATDVVKIESQKTSFWRQLTGAIDFGYDFTSGNSQTSLSSDANANYLSTKWMAGATFTSSFSGQSQGSKTKLLELQTLDGVFLSHNSYLLGLADFLHSSQQDLNLRVTLGGGYGRYLLRNNHNVLGWLAGTVYTNENFESASGQPAHHNIEALVGLQYQLFRFDRYSMQSQLLVYPGLSDAGRIRTTTKTTFTVKLSNNFHTDFSFWDNFDSRPPFNSKQNELGISNSLGWTF
jgi:putative salt-induced outer membrane protein YdiY